MDDPAVASQMAGAQVSAAADQVPGTPDPVDAGGPTAASYAATSDGEKASNASQRSTKQYKRTLAVRDFLANAKTANLQTEIFLPPPSPRDAIVKTAGFHAWRPASPPPSSCLEMRPQQPPEKCQTCGNVNCLCSDQSSGLSAVDTGDEAEKPTSGAGLATSFERANSQSPAVAETALAEGANSKSPAVAETAVATKPSPPRPPNESKLPQMTTLSYMQLPPLLTAMPAPPSPALSMLSSPPPPPPIQLNPAIEIPPPSVPPAEPPHMQNVRNHVSWSDMSPVNGTDGHHSQAQPQPPKEPMLPQSPTESSCQLPKYLPAKPGTSSASSGRPPSAPWPFDRDVHLPPPSVPCAIPPQKNVSKDVKKKGDGWTMTMC